MSFSLCTFVLFFAAKVRVCCYLVKITDFTYFTFLVRYSYIECYILKMPLRKFLYFVVELLSSAFYPVYFPKKTYSKVG